MICKCKLLFFAIPFLVLVCLGLDSCGGGSLTPSVGPPSSPALTVSPSKLDFASVSVGTQSSKTATLINTGTGVLTVSQATMGGSIFKFSGLKLPLSLDANQSATFSVTFAPSVGGSATGALSLVSNAAGSPTTIPLSGTGAILQLTLTPASLSFGNVTVGQNAALPVAINNIGSADVAVSQVTVTGAGFTMSGKTLPLTLAAGQSTNLTITFDPAAVGNFAGNLTVVSNAPSSPNTEPLSGAGVTSQSHSVALSWTPSSASDVAGYNAYRSLVSGGPYTKLNGNLVPGTSYADLAVTAGQTYYYVTTAVDNLGVESAYSNQASATIPTP